MKPVVANRETSCYCVRIEAATVTVRLTDYPRDLTMSNAQVYQTDSGYSFTGMAAGTGTSSGVVDLSGVADIAGIDKDMLASGLFDGARLYLFKTSWDSPVEDEEQMAAAILGKTRLDDDRYTIEMMTLLDALNQTVGKTYSPSCDKKFGGQEFAGCKVALGPLTVTGSLSGVTSQTIIVDSSLADPADYFAGGVITMTSGDNSGLDGREIKAFAAGGAITLYEPFYYAVAPGDTYSMTPGCRKRLEDCRDKWNNVVNFGGFPNVPTQSQYSKYGDK